MSYLYKITIKERGYVDVPINELTSCELQKYEFVKNHLTRTLYEANCGWEHAQYRVMETPNGTKTEFLVLWAEVIDNSGSRWMNVTGDSLGQIMCTMCDNLW